MTMQSIVTTEGAVKRIRSVLGSQDGSSFRVYVTGGGCSGFQYGFKFDNDIKKTQVKSQANL